MRVRRHRAAIWAVLMVGALALLAPHATTPARAASDRPVMAFYYPWYEPGDWSYDKMSDVAAPTYSGGDEATLRRHIQQAADAGIDALICTWYGPNEDRLNKRCRRLLQLVEGSGRDIKVAIIPDQSAAFDPAMRTVDGLAAALDVLRRDFMGSPAYFRFQGKPAVYWFNPPSLGDVGTWQALRGRADPNHDEYWFGGTDNFGYLDVYDALYYFDISWEARPGAAMASYGGRLDRYNSSHGSSKPFIATVMPGYDDIKIRNGHRRDRANGDYYRGTWQTAIDRNAAGVIVTSWNEFFEGSHIEPSQQYGDLYLRLTKEWSDKYHAGQAAPPPAPPQGGSCRQFPETGHQVCGRILEYWDQNGGLPVFGYPLTDQTAEKVEGQTVQAQLFERNRLELHPENARPYDVLLGRLGAGSLGVQGRDWQTFPKASPSAPHYFAETGHAIAPEFWDYWAGHGLEFDGRPGKSFNESLALFGLPLSEATVETNPTNGQQYLTQHFERARFEYHPENAGTPYAVLLGLLGRELTGMK
ncbi:MAG TPA: glycoside hydrolase family 99-like domain-containing protein [Kouleothrix sp.]|uniref:glycoside hydrolase family 99-like domain-containing protein n=1 Tax=Kouleothrix sp. TaxID=2779161 RepID=UPI002D18DE64|nr:glycoside hydrolase family 99-like domain-containing protein [Kouleothrix sp.]HRC74372.1 glycoside hydrolase family 99-like domain-containing protein [Kouleothrix sp.]